jgi:hypothetical protein
MVLVGKPEGKRRLGRLRRKWEDSIRIDLEETDWKGVGWIDQFQDRNNCWAVVNTVTTFLESIKCGEFIDRPWNCQFLK